MYYQAFLEHKVELLERALDEQKYLRKLFSDELKKSLIKLE